MPSLAAGQPESFVEGLQIVWHYRWTLVAAFAVSALATPVLRKLAVRHDIIDRPDLARKHHRRPIAYLGGVGIFLGWAAGVFICLFIAPHYYSDASLVPSVSFPLSILVGAVAIVVVGLIDDIYIVSPRVKIGGQLLAASALAMQDVGPQLMSELSRAMTLNVPESVNYALGAALIAIFVLGGCNAVNLLDGLDGLAGGVIAIGSLGFLFLSLSVVVQEYDANVPIQGADPFTDPVRIVMCLATLGAVLGFLLYNFNPASIFMGDTGSLLLGFLSVATILLFAHTAESGPRLVVAALMVFGLPITDTLLAIVRRLVHGAGLFAPDNQHLHHKLLRMGLSVKQAVFVLYGVSAAFAVLGGLMTLPFVRFRHAAAVLLLWLLSVIALGIVMGLRRKRALRRQREQHAAQRAAERAAASAGQKLDPAAKRRLADLPPAGSSPASDSGSVTA